MTRKSRKNTRVDCAIEGRVLGRRGFQRGTVHNLSTGGLFFAGPSLAVEKRADLEFTLDGGPVHATCEVLYRQGHGEGAGIGVRFLRINAAAVERIRKYLAEGGEPTGKQV
jgi:hypothetical protein